MVFYRDFPSTTNAYASERGAAKNRLQFHSERGYTSRVTCPSLSRPSCTPSLLCSLPRVLPPPSHGVVLDVSSCAQQTCGTARQALTMHVSKPTRASPLPRIFITLNSWNWGVFRVSIRSFRVLYAERTSLLACLSQTMKYSRFLTVVRGRAAGRSGGV